MQDTDTLTHPHCTHTHTHTHIHTAHTHTHIIAIVFIVVVCFFCLLFLILESLVACLLFLCVLFAGLCIVYDIQTSRDGDFSKYISNIVFEVEQGHVRRCFPNCVACTQVTIQNDAVLEEEFETFSIDLSHSDPSVNITDRSATITIVDNNSEWAWVELGSGRLHSHELHACAAKS